MDKLNCNCEDCHCNKLKRFKEAKGYDERIMEREEESFNEALSFIGGELKDTDDE